MTDDIKARLLAMDDCDGRGCAVCAAIATIEALEAERDEYKATMEAEVDRLLVIEEQQQAEIARLRARVEVLEEQSRIRQKMLHYIAFVLIGDENGDAQSAADRVQERIEALEGERDVASNVSGELMLERRDLRAQLAARDDRDQEIVRRIARLLAERYARKAEE